MKRWLASLFTCLVLLVPVFTYAAGFVPCGGPNEPPCQTCHVIDLVNNLLSWLVVILGTIAAIMIVFAGFKLVTSGGNQAAMKSAKDIMTNIIIGYIIVLAGWLLIDFGMKALLNEGTFGVWNEVQCVTQPVPTFVPRVTATGANQTAFTQGDVTLNVAAIQNSGDVLSMVTTAAQQAGLDAYHQDVYTALIMQESNMCQNKVSPAGALGCGQMLLPTAQAMDPSATSDRLLNDDAYNLSLSSQHFADLLAQTGGDTRSALAAYNGGIGATYPSSDCPGLERWECVWDSPGCYNTGITTCEVNDGYNETRNYVSNILSMAGQL